MNAHSHYFKDVSHLKEIDVYRVIDLFEVHHPALQHALKKVIACGCRGAKDARQDAQEAIDSLQRYLAMDDEDRKQGDPHFDLRATYVHGEMWQERRGSGDWQDIATRWDGKWKAAEPAFNPHHQYRKKPDMLDLPVIDSQINADKAADPHAELRKTFRKGQLWQYRVPGEGWHQYDATQDPNWSPGLDYRRHPDCTWKEPEAEDPHAELRKTWRKGQVWQRIGPMSSGWADINGEPEWWPSHIYRRSPDCVWKEPAEHGFYTTRRREDEKSEELPKPAEKPWYPDDSGEWVEVPDDLMEMPKELKPGQEIQYLLSHERDAETFYLCSNSPEYIDWNLEPGTALRVVAYKVVKP